MYLIVERSYGRFYAYFESKDHFKVADSHRKELTRIQPTNLDAECDLSLQGDNYYMVIPVKKKKILKMRMGIEKDRKTKWAEEVLKSKKNAKKATKKSTKKKKR